MILSDRAFDLKESARKIGKLYPILLDGHGNVIDGKRRLEADTNWPKIRLNEIKSKEQLTIAKLASNVCRREISAKEKSGMLEELAEMYIQKGVRRERLAYEISDRTGMSYRWVMQYLPDNYKIRPGLGGPKLTFDVYNSKEELYKSKVAESATLQIAISTTEVKERILSVKNYSNTNFVHIIMENRYYMKLKEIAERLNLDPEMLINNILLSVLKTYTNQVPIPSLKITA